MHADDQIGLNISWYLSIMDACNQTFGMEVIELEGIWSSDFNYRLWDWWTMLDISPFSLVFTLFYKYGLGAPKAKKLKGK